MSQYNAPTLTSPLSGSQFFGANGVFQKTQDALLSSHFGTARPAYASEGTVWLDGSTTPWKVNLFDGSDDITLFLIYPAGNTAALPNGAVGTDQLANASISFAKLGAEFTAAGKALFDDADASAQLTTLGVSPFIKTLLDDSNAATARTTLGAASLVANTFTGLQVCQAGLQLPNANQAGNVTLDWYEKGSFTPVILGDTTAGVGTYVEQVGNYTRVGRLVTYNAVLRWTAHTGTGALKIGGFPWSFSNIFPAVVLWSALGLSGSQSPVPAGEAGASNLVLYAGIVGASAGSVAISMDSAANLFISGSFVI